MSSLHQQRDFECPPDTKAFGGELPLGRDPLMPHSKGLPEKCIAFSHGRAAISWLLETRGPFEAALASAYTCPTVPSLLEKAGLQVFLVDALSEDWQTHLSKCPGNTLVLVPALLGHLPRCDLDALARAVEGRGLVVVDGAQTAFAHLWLETPENVAVLSAPRKCTSLPDGAVLRLSDLNQQETASVNSLPPATEAVAFKLAARALLVSRSHATEHDALKLIKRSEDAWPEGVHSMSAATHHGLTWMDADKHAKIRKSNWRALAQALDGTADILELSGGVPFNLSILVDDRSGILSRLQSRRVFATPLWFDARHDLHDHPVAERFSRQLIGLPIDQRYNEADMLELGKLVRECLAE